MNIQKTSIVLLFLLSSFTASIGQVIYNDGAAITIDSANVLFGNANIINTDTSYIKNEGTLYAAVNLINDSSSTLEGDGIYKIGEDWINTANFNADSSIVAFIDTADSEVTSSGDAFAKIQLDKAAGKQLKLLDELKLTDSFSFKSNDNYVQLDDKHFICGPLTVLHNSDADNFFITNSTGELRKESLANFTFPVGFSSSTYNPLSLVESGTTDTLGVRCREHALLDGSSGSTLSNVVDASWELSEMTSGGSNLSMTTQWAATDELGSFDRTDCGIAHYTGSNWDLTQTLKAAAGGGGPYTSNRSNISSLGTFAVGGDPVLTPLLVDLKILLEGPYDSGGEMTDLLRQNSHIPSSEPFSGLGYTHAAPGGSETVSSSVLNVSGSDAIIDWVFVEIRTGSANTTTVATRAALLQKDGDIVDTDGVSKLNFAGIGVGSYFVLVRPRNHIGLMTPSSLSLSTSTTTLHDFSSSTANVMGGALAVTDLGGGYFAAFSGDYNGNGQVQNTDGTGLILDIGLSGYRAGDLDMNGQVQNSELQNILIPNIGKGVQFDY